MFSFSAGHQISTKVIPLMVSPCNALYGGDQLGYQKHSICWSWGGDLYTLTLIAMLFDRYLGSAVDLGKQRNGIQETMGHCPHPLCTLESFRHTLGQKCRGECSMSTECPRHVLVIFLGKKKAKLFWEPAARMRQVFAVEEVCHTHKHGWHKCPLPSGER